MLHPTQRDILNRLDDEPGLNHTEICEEFNLARGTVQHHLQSLEEEGHIHSVSSGRETHYFLAAIPRETAQKLAELRTGRAMEVVGAVEREPGLIQKDLLEAIGMTRKVLRGYLDRLTAEKLVNEAAVGRQRRYYLTETYEDLLDLLDSDPDGKPSVDADGELD